MRSQNISIISRKILLVFLVFIIVLSIAAIFVRNSIQNRQKDLARLAGTLKPDSDKPEQALFLLHQAEYDFQESLLNQSSKKNISYKNELGKAIELLDTVIKENKVANTFNKGEQGKIDHWVQEKIKLSERLFSLKHNFDSLLSIYSEYEKVTSPFSIHVDTLVHLHKKNVDTAADTIHNIIAKKKGGFFSRLKSAFNGKADTLNSTLIEKTKKEKELDEVTRKVEARDNKLWLKKFKRLQSSNQKLLNLQRSLVSLNTHISTELENMINEVKEINYTLASQLKDLTFRNYEETGHLLNTFGLTSLLLVILFSLLLILFILQLNRAEKQLKKENDRSVVMAQQKTDLLLYMSHEIRNPLTAIYGFLNIFGHTPLSSKQQEMLNSIKLTSDMLLNTLNDTLDAAKLENADFKIHKEPCNPDYVLKLVMESMEFSAQRKNLELKYQFKGNKDTLVIIDSFRVKQVLINLLSNAIKNTKTGRIQVNVDVNETEKKLFVEIVDTGVGISPEQLTKLFSKYYQTASAKGQVGTGLGLFLCKQLVELQGGKITVKSKVGEGSTFSFYIPFEIKETASLPQAVKMESPTVSLNGLKILAIDDNEVNLMVLKMMSSKWSVKFFKAESARQGLDIMKETDIDLVLTDILMPEMDGYELLAAIRKLPSPKNQVPVIMITGLDEEKDNEMIREGGFSAKLLKPFKEKDLLEAIGKSLKGKEAMVV